MVVLKEMDNFLGKTAQQAQTEGTLTKIWKSHSTPTRTEVTEQQAGAWALPPKAWLFLGRRDMF